MSLTFREVREIVAGYVGEAGQCWDSPETAKFARQVMELLLYEGAEPGVRKFSFCSEKGNIVLPKEVEVPLKVRLDHRLAEVWGKWFTYNSSIGEFADSTVPCWDAHTVLKTSGFESPLIYELPCNGSIVGLQAHCEEGTNCFVIVQGLDISGKEVYTTHQGERIVGERFTLEKGKIKYGKVLFGEVRGVIKPKTKGYVSCHAVNPKNQAAKFLADWSPSETRPSYQRYTLIAPGVADTVQVSMLARVKLKDVYEDNELTLFDNSLSIMFAAQRLQAEVNNNDAGAQYKSSIVADILEKEAGYKKISGNPIQVFYPLSGGAIKGIV